MKKLTIFTLLAITVIIGSIVFLYYRDKIFSKEILKLEILSSDSVKMGDEVEYVVKYKNNGNFVLENPKIVFELPENSLTEDGKTRLARDLKDIYPGGEDFVKFKGRLLGREGDLKVAHAWLSYIPKNLSARYESNTTFTTKIYSVPITLTYDLSSKVEKGKEVTYVINYFSNIDYPLENLSIKIDTVNGFNIESAIPESLDNAEWKLATLQKAQGGRITVKGSVIGDAGTTLNFSAHLGMWIDGRFVVIKEATQDVQVINPLLFISEQVNGSFNHIASPGQMLHYQIFIRNIGSSPVDNLFVTSRIDGSAFDLSTLTSVGGQVRNNEGLVVWDAKQIPNLQKLNPGQETGVTFDVKLKDSWIISDSEKNNMVIKNKVNVDGVSQEFDTKLSSKLELSQKAYHSGVNGIGNSGTIPPKAGEVTTYTIYWQVKNYFNDVKNIKIRAILPQNVFLSDDMFPENQAPNFSFDSGSREIVWLAGNLSVGASSSLTFQVALMPSISQKGKPADLIGQATISGEDQFTGKTTQSSTGAVNTTLPDDPSNSGGGIVK